MGVSYRLPEEVGENFYRQLKAAVASQLQNLLPVWDFHLPDICQRSSTASHKQSRMFLESVDDTFLMVDSSTRNGVLLGLM